MPDIPPQVLANWWLGERLGSGFSGSIYQAIHVHTGQVVALKVQRVDTECPTNRYERGFYPLLQGGEGMPTLWASGVAGYWDYLAIDLLGPSLDNLYRSHGKTNMDLQSVCCIAMQVITRLEFMHSRGVLHRDIQLGNCVIGLPPNQHRIYMIDFGFSKSYIDPYTGRHIPDSKARRDFIGNYWFTSVGVHCKGKVPSRRDDLEAAALMFIHLLTPRGLPWIRNGVPKTEADHERLKRAKRSARPEDLCNGLPQEFEEFLRYCRRLKFQDCPDYAKWREEFRALAIEEGFPASEAFIWPPPLHEQKPLTPRAIRMAKRMPAENTGDMENVLQDLAQLHLADRQILGDRKNIASAVRNTPNLAKKEGPVEKPAAATKIIEISSGSEGSMPPRGLTPKAQKLIKLTKALSGASDNEALAGIITEFVAVLQTNSSRNMTKEGFAFLDALHKQLADPSVFVQPMRTSRKRNADKEQVSEPEGRHVKLGVVARLKREVAVADGNEILAKMVAEFGAVTNKGSSGRTVTKDGFAFLRGLATRLKDLDRDKI